MKGISYFDKIDTTIQKLCKNIIGSEEKYNIWLQKWWPIYAGLPLKPLISLDFLWVFVIKSVRNINYDFVVIRVMV